MMKIYKTAKDKELLFTVDLPSKWIQHCANMPESGMGYQDVTIKLTDSPLEYGVKGVIYNCSILNTPIKVDREKIASISLNEKVTS